MKSIMISVTILTHNSGRLLREVLEPLSRFDDVVILDSGSDDNTLEIAQQYSNVQIHHHPLTGFGAQHNRAAKLARHDWILSVDSDEVMTPELIDEIKQLPLNPQSCYSVNRHNHYQRQRIRGCGWAPDWVVRLYNRSVTQWTNDQVHEKVDASQLHVHALRAPLLHYPFHCVDDFMRKMQKYSTLYAQQNGGKKRSSVCKAILHGWWAFIRSYLLKRGFRDGRAGAIISFYNAHSAFYKYIKLHETNKTLMIEQ